MTAWYDKAIFYHMYPLGMTGAPFANPYPVSDETADGTWDVSADSRMDELMQWIPYLESLHISALYIGPLFESSTHGYDTRDFRLIDRRLGTNVSFRSFVDCCHEHGIRVVVDGVFNHTGSNSRYFNAEGFYPELGAAQSQDSLYFDWYSFHPWPTDYDAWWGVRTLPAVNEEAPTYRDFIVRSQDSVVRHWLRQGADGWRLDVADELPDDFIRHQVKTAWFSA